MTPLLRRALERMNAHSMAIGQARLLELELEWLAFRNGEVTVCNRTISRGLGVRFLAGGWGYAASQDLAILSCLGKARVKAGNITYPQLGHVAVPRFHLAHRPFQGSNRLRRIGDNRAQEMRNPVIHRKFKHLWINHDHPAAFRRMAIQQRQDHRIDTD